MATDEIPLRGLLGGGGAAEEVIEQLHHIHETVAEDP